MHSLLAAALVCLICLTAQAQTFQIRNAVSADVALAFDARAVIEGEEMLDDIVMASDLPFGLAGVTITLNAQPCRLISVAPRTIVFVLPSPFSAFRGIYLLTLKTPLLTVSKFVKVQRVAPVLAIQHYRQNSKLVMGFWRGSNGVTGPITDTGIPTTNVGTAVYISLVGSGFRNNLSRPQATVTIKAPTGVEWKLNATISAFQGLPGLDTVDFFLPSELRKAGICEVVVAVEGHQSSIVELKID